MSKDLVELSNALAQAPDRAAGNVVAIHGEGWRRYRRHSHLIGWPASDWAGGRAIPILAVKRLGRRCH